MNLENRLATIFLIQCLCKKTLALCHNTNLSVLLFLCTSEVNLIQLSTCPALDLCLSPVFNNQTLLTVLC